MTRKLTILWLAAGLAACSDLEHTNPHDPATPPDRQGRAILAGEVLLEPGPVAPPLAGIRVSIPGTSLGADTDAAGRYAIAGVPPGAFALQAVAPGYATGALTGVVVTLDDAGHAVAVPPMTLALARGAVTGSVSAQAHAGVDGGAAPLAGASVSLAGLPGAVATDAAGGFHLAGVPAGTWTLNVGRVGFADATVGAVTVGASALAEVGTVTMAWDPGGVAGTVTVPGATDSGGVTVRIKGVTVVGTSYQATTASAPDGSWGLEGLVPAGDYNVTFELADHGVAGTSVTVAPHATTTLPAVSLVRRSGSLQGVFALQGAASSAGVVVTATGLATASTVTGAGGAFTLAGLPVGTYTVTARHDPDFDAVTVTGVAVSADATTTVPGSPRTLPLVTSGFVAGTVAVERGAPGGVTIALSGVDRNGAAVTRASSTGVAGDYAISGLPNGTYRLSFSKSGYDAAELAGIAVSGAAAAAPPVTLRVARGTITGTATLTAGAVTGFPVGADRSGIVVTLAGADVPVPAAVTDASGTYRFEGVPVSLTASPYTITATKPWFTPQATTVVAVAGHAPAAALTLPIAAGSLSGTARATNVLGGGDALSSGGISVGLTGTAFDGTAWSAATATDATGSWTSPALPPGTYQVIATAPGRDCEPYADVVVGSGPAAPAGNVLCLDARAPSGLALGAPNVPAGAEPGYTNGDSVVVPIVTHASDPTSPSNLSGYDRAIGVTPEWASSIVSGTPASLTFSGLAPDAVQTLWARAVDTAGNVGPATAVQITTDTLPPATPTVVTPRAWVDATTASATIQGSEGDRNFAGYELCLGVQSPTLPCAAAPPGGACTWTRSGSAAAISLVANQRTCVWARAFDRAGNLSGVASAGAEGVTSDLLAPRPPALSPAFDASVVTIRAPWVDFFVSAASTDEPGTGWPWDGVSHLEVDTGSGFSALCRAEACRPGGTWTPCGCGCTDERLLCDGARFVGIRVKLQQGTRNSVAVRAVDLAGNVGAGVGQQVQVDAIGDVLAGTTASEYRPVVRGRLVTWPDTPAGGSNRGWILDLGPERRFDPLDARCLVPDNYYTAAVHPASDTLVLSAHTGMGARLTRAGADGRFCTGDDTTAMFYVPGFGWTVDTVSGSGERAAWALRDIYNAGVASLYVADPGANGLLGDPDDVTTSIAHNHLGDVVMGDRALLYRFASCGVSCYTWGWRIRQTTSAGPWASVFDLPPLASQASLSVDGSRVAWLENDGHLRVRDAGADGLFGTSDDAVAAMAPPAGMSFQVPAVDGGRVVAIASSGVNGVFDWSSGTDGVFGTADDLTVLRFPTSGDRMYPSLSDGYFVSAQENDIVGFDLSVLRWETGVTTANAIGADGRGHLLLHRGTLDSRAPTGAEHTGPGASRFSVSGVDLVSVRNDGAVQHHRPAPDGTWFGTGAPGPVDLYQVPDSGMGYVQLVALAVGGGKAVLRDYTTAGDPNSARVRVLEPNGGSLATFPSTGSTVDLFPAGLYAHGEVAVSARQALFVCNDSGVLTFPVCVHDAGADGRFGTPDDPVPATFAAAPKLVHPAGSPRVGQLVLDPRVLKISGNRLLVAEFGQGTFLFDAGADGLFATPDDTGRQLGPFGYTADLAGDWAVWFDDGAPAGVQVWMARGMTGAPVPVTAHYSTKSSLAVEPSGRVFWLDRVFDQPVVFQRAQ